jgi:hypothetical protein
MSLASERALAGVGTREHAIIEGQHGALDRLLEKVRRQ